MPELAPCERQSKESAITFACSGAELVGIFHSLEVVSSDVAVLIIVGGPQYRVGSHRQFVMLARTLATAGYPVLRFDYRGMGDSSGETRTFETIQDDIRCAVDALIRLQPGVRRLVLFGLCDAASAAMMYCTTDARVKGLILANPWARTETGLATAYTKYYYPARLFSPAFWQKLLEGRVDIAASFRHLIRSLRQSLARSQGGRQSDASFVERMLRSFVRFEGSTLLLISENDLTAKEFISLCAGSVDWGRATSRQNVLQMVLPGADHTFSARTALTASNEAILRWLAG